jgi:hypothetical protein
MKTNTRRNTPQTQAQVIGSPEAMLSGRPPVYRELELKDITDDCPACLANRKLILEGRPPMVWVFE